MARKSHTAVQVPKSASSAGAALTFTAADPLNKEEFAMTGRELLLARNAGAAGHTVQVTSFADPFGRTGDIAAQAVAAGGVVVFPLFDLTGWVQPDGKLYFEADSSEVEFAVLRLP